MGSVCGSAGHPWLIGFGCFVYDFQTLLTGALAIAVAVFAGVPVWRQLKDSNLQTRISHRETLASLLRDSLSRFEKVDLSIGEPLSMASDVTSDPLGDPRSIDAHDAHGLEQALSGVLDWYLVVLADTEHPDVEAQKSKLRVALSALTDTLNDAHWADHNDQSDEDHDIPDDKWAEILARCAAAKTEAYDRTVEARKAYHQLTQAQHVWAQSLRSRLAKLDLEIAAAK